MIPVFDQAQTSSGRSPQTPAIDQPARIGFHGVQATPGGACTSHAGARRGNQTPWVVRWISAAPATPNASNNNEPVFTRRLTMRGFIIFLRAIR